MAAQSWGWLVDHDGRPVLKEGCRAAIGLRPGVRVVPTQGVEAEPAAPCTALGLTDQSRGQTEEGGNLGQQTAGHLAQVGMAAGRPAWADPDQSVIRGQLDHRGLRLRLEMFGQRSHPGEGRLGGAEGDQLPHEMALLGPGEEALADMESDGSVPCDQGGRIEQSHRFTQRAPGAGVTQGRERAALAGQGQCLGRADIAVLAVHHGQQHGDDRSRNVTAPGVTGRLVSLDGHRSSFNPSAS